MIRIEKNKFIFVMVSILEMLTLMLLYLYDPAMSYKNMAIIGITQWIINVILLKFCSGLELFSIPNIFSFFSMIFHCGQILKKGFGIKGDVPLPFENYATPSTIQAAFFFYLFSQTIYYVAVLVGFHASRSSIQSENNGKELYQLDVTIYGKVLLILGVIPRIYVDVLSFMAARSNGYAGVYSLYIPSVVQTMAFFFDAGLIFMLFNNKKFNATVLFLLVLGYKCLMMMTGSRQDKVAFLCVWVYVYFFIINKITLWKSLLLTLICAVGFVFISAIGELRGGDLIRNKEILAAMQGDSISNMFGGALGEFGSAFNTLEVAIQYTPSSIPYGYGRTYLAGILSTVPLIVNQIPDLAETVVFLTQLPNDLTFAFGGSYLGELYYNFSWFGIAGSYIIGVINTKLHNCLTEENENQRAKKCLYAVIATAMILFVRGYFTDMVQKLVWTYFIIYIVWLYQRKLEYLMKKDERW